MKFDREGRFRGPIMESGVSRSTGGFPQFVAKIMATEFYDVTTKEWIPWQEYSQSGTAFLILAGANEKATINAKNLVEALGWDGVSYGTLNDTDYTATPIQFDVKDNDEYGFQIDLIHAADADPNRVVGKLDADKIKDLDAKFSSALADTAPAKTATKTKRKSSKKPPAPPKSTPPTSPTKVPASPPPATPPAGTEPQVYCPTPCTQQEAWDEACKLKKDDVTDEQLSAEWADAVVAVADGRDQGDLTDEDWGKIRELVIDKVSDIPFDKR